MLPWIAFCLSIVIAFLKTIPMLLQLRLFLWLLYVTQLLWIYCILSLDFNCMHAVIDDLNSFSRLDTAFWMKLIGCLIWVSRSLLKKFWQPRTHQVCLFELQPHCLTFICFIFVMKAHVVASQTCCFSHFACITEGVNQNKTYSTLLFCQGMGLICDKIMSFFCFYHHCLRNKILFCRKFRETSDITVLGNSSWMGWTNCEKVHDEGPKNNRCDRKWKGKNSADSRGERLTICDHVTFRQLALNWHSSKMGHFSETDTFLEQTLL